jgi:hypothetical protein
VNRAPGKAQNTANLLPSSNLNSPPIHCFFSGSPLASKTGIKDEDNPYTKCTFSLLGQMKNWAEVSLSPMGFSSSFSSSFKHYVILFYLTYLLLPFPASTLLAKVEGGETRNAREQTLLSFLLFPVTN